MPARIALIGWELDEFQRVAVRIMKVEGLYSRGVLVPLGQHLGSGGDLPNLVLLQAVARGNHVRDNDRDMLKPRVVASRILRNGTSVGSAIFDQLDAFQAQLQVCDPNVRAKYARQAIERVEACIA